MQYAMGVLPSGTACHGHSQITNAHDTDPERSAFRQGGGYPSSHIMYTPHQPAPGGCNRGSVSVKEEPGDDQEDGAMVIDLTPGTVDPDNQINLTGHDDVPQHRSGGYLEHDDVRHHPYYRPRAPQSREDACEASPPGNTPSMLASEDSGYSEVEGGQMNSQDGEQNSMVTGMFRFSIPKTSMATIGQGHPRAKREFVPDNKKDDQYWNKRHKNNISARRSRIKRKTMEKLMEHRMVELEQENIRLKYELKALKRMFGDKVDTYLNTSPAGSPGPSSSSSLSSSDLGASASNLSSGGSVEHSTSSSPVLLDDMNRTKKPGFQLKVKLSGLDRQEEREDVDEDTVSPQSALPINTPNCRAFTHAINHSSPTPVSTQAHSQRSYSPPAAHSKSPPVSHSSTAPYLAPAHSLAHNATPLCSTQHSSRPRPAHCSSTMAVHESRPARTDGACHRPQPHREMAWSSEDSPGPASSPSCGVPTSEDDTSSNSGLRWSNWSCGQDEESLQRIPLKCRMKRELHSSYHPTSLSVKNNTARH